jgi:hypothetical protein
MGFTELPAQGMIMVGDKISLMTGAKAQRSKLLVPEEQWKHLRRICRQRLSPVLKEDREKNG